MTKFYPDYVEVYFKCSKINWMEWSYLLEINLFDSKRISLTVIW